MIGSIPIVNTLCSKGWVSFSRFWGAETHRVADLREEEVVQGCLHNGVNLINHPIAQQCNQIDRALKRQSSIRLYITCEKAGVHPLVYNSTPHPQWSSGYDFRLSLTPTSRGRPGFDSLLRSIQSNDSSSVVKSSGVG
jgi:hypothetical protein